MNPPGRKSYLHEVPSCVDPDASDYFITVCCQQRGTNQLCTSEVGPILLSSARFYHEQRKWFPSPFVLMPDHLHMLVGFGRECGIADTIGAWKRYTSRHCGIEWQRNFFEHRLRSTERTSEKAAYILQNPVRAGLVQDASAWPWVLMLD